MTEFLPGPGAERAFRDALGTFGTGVTIVTTRGPDGPVGITANSFSSVSLRPPLVLWSVDRGSDRFAVFEDAQRTAIHVLGADQSALALRFARSGDDFTDLDWQSGEAGVPLLAGCLARFECRRLRNYDGGDHRILLSEVVRVRLGDGDPLLFSRGVFGSFVRGD